MVRVKYLWLSFLSIPFLLILIEIAYLIAGPFTFFDLKCRIPSSILFLIVVFLIVSFITMWSFRSAGLSRHKKDDDYTKHLASFPQESPNPIIELDSYGKITFANSAVNMTLMNLGMDKGDISAFLPPDINDILADPEKQKESYSYREIIIKGRIFREDIYLTSGFNARIYAYDITERKRTEAALLESERKFRTAFEKNPSIMIISSLSEGRLVEVNKAFENIMGYSRKEAIGRTYLEIGLWQDPEKRQRLAGILESQGHLDNLELVLRAKNGELKTVLLSAELITIKEERLIMVSCLDITERKRIEEDLYRVKDELEQRVWERTAELEQRTMQLRALVVELTQVENRERKQLAAVLHDHLQQLLVAAKMGIGVLHRKIKEKDLKESAGKVKNLLEESINESRSLTMELSPPILYEGGLVPAIEWLARWMKEKHGFIVSLADGTGIPEIIEEISTLLFQSIRELLFNAIKHSGVKEARITINMASGNRLQTIIEDKGAGFDVAKAYSRGYKEGFGLFSIRERVNFLGGDMSIDSAPGKGTRIILTMPLHAIGHKTRVLIADDHKIVREGVIKLVQNQIDMEMAGEASDGKEAVEKARELRPDVIIMDIGMPGMSGVEATKIILSEIPEIRIIGFSMHENVESEEAIRKAGAEIYLNKDRPSEDLIAAIRGLHALKV